MRGVVGMMSSRPILLFCLLKIAGVEKRQTDQSTGGRRIGGRGARLSSQSHTGWALIRSTARVRVEEWRTSVTERRSQDAWRREAQKVPETDKTARQCENVAKRGSAENVD
jgi:hypothetical protein